MLTQFFSEHWKDQNGNPGGGVSYITRLLNLGLLTTRRQLDILKARWRHWTKELGKEQYEEGLRRRQVEHFKGLQWPACKHDFSCSCPKCTPVYKAV